MRAPRLPWTLAAAAVLLCLAGCAADEAGVRRAPHANGADDQRFEYRRIVMGAPCTLTVYAPSAEVADAGAGAAFARLATVEEALSDWIATSEARRLPTQAGVTVPIGPDLAAVLARSRIYWLASDGAFDPTVGPLVALWRAARASGVAPTELAIHDALQRVGMQHVQLGSNPDTYTAAIDGIQLDFGGIGQGYGAAQALESLAACGITRALIDISGDIAAGDSPPGTEGWRIAVGDQVIVLRSGAVTLSGDEFQHFDATDGAGGTVRHSHIIDPRTGRPLTSRTAVAVIAPDATDADALATTLSLRTSLRSRTCRYAAQWMVERPGEPPEIIRTPGWPTPGWQ